MKVIQVLSIAIIVVRCIKYSHNKKVIYYYFLLYKIYQAIMQLKGASTAPGSSDTHAHAESSGAHAATEVLTEIPVPNQ